MTDLNAFLPRVCLQCKTEPRTNQPLSISDSEHLSNMAQTSMMIAQPYPVVGQISSPYEQPAKDLNTYATLKAVGKNLTAIFFFFLTLKMHNQNHWSILIDLLYSEIYERAVFGKVTALSSTAVDPRSPLLFVMYTGSWRLLKQTVN